VKPPCGGADVERHGVRWESYREMIDASRISFRPPRGVPTGDLRPLSSIWVSAWEQHPGTCRAAGRPAPDQPRHDQGLGLAAGLDQAASPPAAHLRRRRPLMGAIRMESVSPSTRSLGSLAQDKGVILRAGTHCPSYLSKGPELGEGPCVE